MKRVIYKLLCNAFTGYCIASIFRNSIPDIRWKGFSYSVAGSGMSKTTLASIFWGFYESAEIRFAEKYFTGDEDVLELGSSCGIVSSHFVSKLQRNKRFFAVEANINLFGVLKLNITQYKNEGTDLHFLNKAVHYGSPTVTFHVSENTTASSIGNRPGEAGKQVTVEAGSLSAIIDETKLADFALVCDIEGAEAQVLHFEPEILRNCRYIFIELHDLEFMGKLYDEASMIDQIRQLGFELVDRHGPVCYFKRK